MTPTDIFLGIAIVVFLILASILSDMSLQWLKNRPKRGPIPGPWRACYKCSGCGEILSLSQAIDCCPKCGSVRNRAIARRTVYDKAGNPSYEESTK